MGGALLARNFGKATRQHQLGFVIERSQQLTLPAVPDTGTDGAYIADRQHQQHFQPLKRANLLGKIGDCLAVVEITRLRHHRHGQVILDQPGHELGLLG